MIFSCEFWGYKSTAQACLFIQEMNCWAQLRTIRGIRSVVIAIHNLGAQTTTAYLVLGLEQQRGSSVDSSAQCMIVPP
jgi:hypothetical protein